MKVTDPDRWTKYIVNEANYYIPDQCEGGVAIDCGTNVGAFVLNCQRRFDHYHCFDVLEENVEIMKKNVANTVPNLSYIVEKKACHDIPGVLVPVFAHQDENKRTDSFGNSGNVSTFLYRNGNWGWLEENKLDEVPSVTLEEIYALYPEIEILKFDIECSEHRFLMNKDLSGIKHLVGEIHFSEKEQQPLIDYILRTHNLNHRTSNTFSFSRKVGLHAP